MEPKFQTSFIPKKPLATVGGNQVFVKSAKRGISIYMTVSVLIFILSLAGIGGAYFWKSYQLSLQEKYSKQLAERQKEFDLNAISQLKEISTQIETAKQLLQQHVALSQIFGIIQSLTIENVRFLSLNVSMPKERNGNVVISMNGVGKNLPTVAFQAKVLSNLEQHGLRDLIKNPIITNPSLDPNSAVTFGFSAEVDPKLLTYSRSIGATAAAETSEVQE